MGVREGSFPSATEGLVVVVIMIVAVVSSGREISVGERDIGASVVEAVGSMGDSKVVGSIDGNIVGDTVDGEAEGPKLTDRFVGNLLGEDVIGRLVGILVGKNELGDGVSRGVVGAIVEEIGGRVAKSRKSFRSDIELTCRIVAAISTLLMIR